MFPLFENTNRKSSLISPTGKKRLKEEEAFIKIIRDDHRKEVREYLLKQLGHEPPSEDVEGVLDLLVKDLEEKGEIKSMVAEYLEEKITEERAKFKG